MTDHTKIPRILPALTALAMATAMLAACGGDDSSSPSASTPAVAGTVVSAAVKNPTGAASSSAAGVVYDKSTTGDAVQQTFSPIAYANATVCADTNANGLCDTGEISVKSAADGSFKLNAAAASLVAVVGTDATYVDPQTGATTKVAKKMILRSAADQAAKGASVVISPLSTEVVRLTEAEKQTYATATAAIAGRLSLSGGTADVTVAATDVVAAPAAVTSASAKAALLAEDNLLATRFTLASTMLDRGYASDAATDPVTTVKAAQDAAFNPEGIPRYDHLFVIVFENHSNQKIDDPAYPNFYNYLNVEGNKASNYFSTGNPSEPNYISLASADDWAVADDNPWNCLPAGDTVNTATDVYVPLVACTDPKVHNLKNRRNMFTAMYKAGMGTRVYSESMDPGQDPRKDNVGNAAIIAANASSPATLEAMPGNIYRTKHHPAVNFDDVRTRPDFFKNLARTVGGGQWDSAIATYAASNGINWNTHQFEDDLKSGDIGALNYIVPDQCDDIHGTGGSVDCVNTAPGITRGDKYAKYLVETIKASPIWKNTNRRSAIVMLFDEGSSFFGSSSCCGWNVGGGATSGAPLEEGITTAVPLYNTGNKGDGPTIFSLLTNQAGAPKKIIDSDSYSHFSFVRTMQDMFALSDPGVNTSYMNRSKYTEKYIASNLANLAEYSGSANTHFDSVRPMNHKYVVKAGDLQSGGTTAGGPGSGSVGTGNNTATGADATQTNIWATKS